jgi:hypothetical protein
MAEALNQQQNRWAKLLGRSKLVNLNILRKENQDSNEFAEPSREFIKTQREGAKRSLGIRRPPKGIARAYQQGTKQREELRQPPKGLSELLKKSEKIQKRLLNSKKRFFLKGKLKGGTGGIMDQAAAPVRKGTNKLLKASWKNLIQSFGLTLIWINMHVFLRFVFGQKLFCKLGQEWIPEKVSKTIGTAGKNSSKTIGIAEVIVLLVLDLIVLAVLALIIAIVGVVVYAQIHPIGFYLAVWQDTLSVIREIVGL